MEVTESIRDQIMARVGTLSPKLRSAAEYVASHPGEIATRSLRQIARSADLNPPTLSRLARALDFKNYEDLRETCRDELKRERRNRGFADKAELLQQFDTDISPSGDSGIVISQAKSAVTNIQKLMETVDLEKLREAADMIVSARHVVLVGGPSTLAMVNYFARMAHIAFDNWIVAGLDGAWWSHEIVRLGEGDAVFVVSLNPYSNLCIKAAQLSRDAGADVIAVTDGFTSPLAGIANHCFMVETDSPLFFPSHVAALVFIEGLMGMIVRRGGDQITKRIRSVEAASGEFGEYWQN